jgi:four helix bundle protein
VTSEIAAKFSFQRLKVWQKSVAFAENVIRIVDDLATDRKHFRLIEQLEAASTSVAMNIAEGKGRQSTKEYIQFLYIARASLFEAITLLIIFKRLGWLTQEMLDNFLERAEEIAKMLNSLIKTMRKKTG